MSARKGKLYLIPLPISEAEEMHIPNFNHEILPVISHYVVERIRTARRFIRKAAPEVVIDDLTFLEIDKHGKRQNFRPFFQHALEGHNIGLMSEAGMPAIADPGSRVVSVAHELGIEVIPLVGPSSILLALAGSGMNGQYFTFHGYLARDKGDLGKKLQRLESDTLRYTQTQIFIEAPYRNNRIVEIVLETLAPHVRFCIACDLLSADAFLESKTIEQWKQSEIPDLHKRPTIFLVGK